MDLESIMLSKMSDQKTQQPYEFARMWAKSYKKNKETNDSLGVTRK